MRYALSTLFVFFLTFSHAQIESAASADHHNKELGGSAIISIDDYRIGDFSNFDIGIKSIAIKNMSNQKLNFNLAFPGGVWGSYQIDSRSNPQTYGLGDYDKMYIRICTSDKGCIQYYLEGANRYGLYWNANTSKWDVVKLTND